MVPKDPSPPAVASTVGLKSLQLLLLLLVNCCCTGCCCCNCCLTAIVAVAIEWIGGPNESLKNNYTHVNHNNDFVTRILTYGQEILRSGPRDESPNLYQLLSMRTRRVLCSPSRERAPVPVGGQPLASNRLTLLQEIRGQGVRGKARMAPTSTCNEK